MTKIDDLMPPQHEASRHVQAGLHSEELASLLSELQNTTMHLVRSMFGTRRALFWHAGMLNQLVGVHGQHMSATKLGSGVRTTLNAV